MIGKLIDGDNVREFKWVSWVPIKMTRFNWGMFINRVPVTCNLVVCGISLTSTVCPFCNTVEEEVDHVFIMCIFASRIWRWFCSWINAFSSPPNDSEDLLKMLRTLAHGNK